MDYIYNNYWEMEQASMGSAFSVGTFGRFQDINDYALIVHLYTVLVGARLQKMYLYWLNDLTIWCIYV